MSDHGRMTTFPRTTVTLPGFRRAGWVALLVPCWFACVKQLPPAPTPPPVVPVVQAANPPGSGQSQLIVDVVEGPTAVQRVGLQSTPVNTANGRPSYRFSEVPTSLCAPSPCTVAVPVGNILLGFPVIGNNELETELVNVGPDPSVYRRSLSVYTDRTGATRVLGIIATALGGTAAITGTVLLPIGLSKGNDGLTTAGAITLGGGALLLVAGIWAIRHDAPTFRPGSSNHFPVPR